LAPADRYETAADFAAALEAAPRVAYIEKRTSGPSIGFTRSRKWALAGSLLFASAIIVALVKTMSSGPLVAEGIPEGDPRRVAVLYFDDLSPSSLPPYVADGLTEDLIDQLGGVPALHVISPNGVRPFRGSAVRLDSIAGALKVGTIVSGSVARSGSTIRINVRLIDAATGQQLYSRPVEARWSELFALQDKLADQVAFFLRQRLGETIALRELRAATKSSAAWELVQMASDLTRRATEAGVLRADTTAAVLLLRSDSLYVRAAQLDPAWVLPLVRRGRLALAQGNYSTFAPPRVDSVAYQRMTRVERRTAWARRAIELANQAVADHPATAGALALRGDARFQLLVDGAEVGDSLAVLAERDLRTALELRPNLAGAWGTLARLFRQAGRFSDAAAAAQRAYEADAYFEVRTVAAVGFMASLHAEQIDDARRWCRIGLDHYAGDPRFTECELTLLGWTGRSPGEVASAWRFVDQIERRDSFRILAATWKYRRLMVAAILARGGMRDSARSVLSTIERLQTPDVAGGSYMTEAYVRVLLGDRDGALARLASHLQASPQTRAQIAKHPWFRDLNRDPRFQSLARPVR
jgi:TolB-like protein